MTLGAEHALTSGGCQDDRLAIRSKRLQSSSRRKDALLNQGLTQIDTVRVVYVENNGSGTTNAGAAHKNRADPPEVPVPLHAARVEQPHELTRERIDPSQVRALVQIAVVTGESEI